MERRLKEQEEAIMEKEKKIRDNNEFMIDALSSVKELRNRKTDNVKISRTKNA